jgi:hypothetical protein
MEGNPRDAIIKVSPVYRGVNDCTRHWFQLWRNSPFFNVTMAIKKNPGAMAGGF